jgi:ribosome-associated translation inhibitor RaiA
MAHSIHELAEDIRRQVKKHRDKRRKRSQTRRLVNRMRGRAAES